MGFIWTNGGYYGYCYGFIWLNCNGGYGLVIKNNPIY